MDGEEFCKILSDFTTIPEKERFTPVLQDPK
jgi:cell division protease FtsH